MAENDVKVMLSFKKIVWTLKALHHIEEFQVPTAGWGHVS